MALTLHLESFSYPGAGELFHAIDLSVAKGESVALVGGSGSGKSSLLTAFAGLHPEPLGGRFRGSLTLEGKPPEEGVIGYLGADPDLFLTGFCRSVKEEVGWSLFGQGWELDRILERVDDTLEVLGLSKLAERDPRDLSGGQRQLVALAAVWARRPQYLLLDEPVSRLDPTARLRLQELVRQLLKTSELGLIWATSDLSPVWWCETVWELGTDSNITPYPAEHFSSIKSQAVLPWTQQWPLKCGLSVPPWTSQECPEGVKFPEFSFVDEREIVLSADSLTFAPPCGQPLFEEFRWQLHRGERVALVGPNGAGKTTLGRLLRGLLRPLSGTVKCLGVPLSNLPVWQTAESIAYTFQDPNQLFARARVDEELRYTGELLGWREEKTQDRVEQALALFELKDCSSLHPRELNARQAALLGLAISWMSQAAVQVLDEPLARLDRSGRAILERVLEDWERSQTSLVLIGHDLDWLATVCHRFSALDSGRLVAEGSAQEVFESPLVRRLIGKPVGLTKHHPNIEVK